MDDLLRPVLSGSRVERSIFSPRALFFTAFFGGPVGVLLFSLLNTKRLKRVKSDFLFYLIAPLLLFLFLYFVIIIPEGAEGFKWLRNYRSESFLYKYGPRMVALVFWGVSYALHRKFHQTMGIMGIKPPSPWIPAIICSIIGGVINFGLLFSVLKLKGGL